MKDTFDLITVCEVINIFNSKERFEIHNKGIESKVYGSTDWMKGNEDAKHEINKKHIER